MPNEFVHSGCCISSHLKISTVKALCGIGVALCRIHLLMNKLGKLDWQQWHNQTDEYHLMEVFLCSSSSKAILTTDSAVTRASPGLWKTNLPLFFFFFFVMPFRSLEKLVDNPCGSCNDTYWLSLRLSKHLTEEDASRT